MTVLRCDRRLFHVMLALWLVLSGAASGHAQTRPAEPAARPSVDQDTTAANATGKANTSSSGGLLDVLFSVGLTGLLILLALLLLSITAVALAIEHLMTIRQKVLMPPGLADQVHTELTTGKLAAADQACSAQSSFLAFVLHAGLAEVDGGWTAVEKAMEDAAAQQAARLFRKIEYLSVIGNIAPMIGLLGTVTGMIFAFQQVADTQGAARAGQLAEGIYTALITTVGGLLVAIPSLAAFAVFRNRVDQLVAEVAYAAHHVTVPLKRALARRAAAAAAPRPVTRGGQ
jgi:biopolymer transport protein ExbB